MKILMISLDKGLAGGPVLGDVIERHRRYGEFVDQLDIIVLTKKNFGCPFAISSNVYGYATNSGSKFYYYRNALRIGDKLFKEKYYDLIVTQTPFICGLIGYRLAKRYKSKLLVHFHGDFWMNPNWLKEKKINYIFLLISKVITPRADAIRVMSNGQKEKLILAGIDKEKIHVISTPVDLKKYSGCQNTKPAKNEKVVLHIGRYDKSKDFSTLDKTLGLIVKIFPHLKFIQVGAGEKIKEDIRSIGVESHPLTDHNELLKFLCQSTLLILSSSSESFGKVLVEANACGIPVVSTSTTGAKEIVRDGYNGFLVPIGDSQALAEKAIELLADEGKAEQMGKNGRQLVWEKYADNTKQIVNLWKEIVNKHEQ